VVPEDAARAVGAAFVLPMSVTPPKKLEVGIKSFWNVAGKLLIQATGLLVKTPGLTMTMVEGGFVLAFANGTRFEGNSSGFKLIVVDSVGIATALIIDANGIRAALVPGGVPKLVWALDGTTGSVMSQGMGAYVAKHPTGFLGVVPTFPIAYGIGGTTASGTWMVQL